MENLAPRGQEPRFARPSLFEQVDPLVKSGALSRPVAIDWNGDGKLDILAGNGRVHSVLRERRQQRRTCVRRSWLPAGRRKDHPPHGWS